MAIRIVTEQNVASTGDNFCLYIEGFCDSEDTKPTASIATGSLMIEADTGDVYLYSEKDTDWIKQMSLQG